MEMSSLTWMQGSVDIRCVNYADVLLISWHDALLLRDRMNSLRGACDPVVLCADT